MAVRLIYYGGAREQTLDGKIRKTGVSDNSAFKIAAQNIQKTYKNMPGQVIVKKITTASHIVNDINNQHNGSVLSLDIISHGSPLSLNFSSKAYENSEFYVSWLGKQAISYYYSDDDGDYIFSSSSRSISDIKFNKFSDDVRIQFHGCLTASDWFRSPNGKKIFPILVDNIAKEVSDQLDSAGKKNSLVIGHTTRGNPLINGKSTKILDQDYRHGKRVVYYHNGKSFETTRKGFLDKEYISRQTDR